MSVSEALPLREPVPVPGPPLIGSLLPMARDPARFFADCYRKYGSVFRIRLLGHSYTVLAGPEAAHFMGTREGKECLRSKEFWSGLVNEYGATRVLTGEDGEGHKELRDILRHGYSKESIKGRYNELIAITDRSIERDWKTGERVPTVRAMQFMVTDQLGSILTGKAPLEYVSDIRTTILYILNVLVTRQRPKFMLLAPSYRKAKARVFELGRQMIADWKARGPLPEDAPERTLVDDIMDAHVKTPGVMPERDLILVLTGPYVAGLDTVANTTAAVVYTVLKHPEVLKQVQAEVDAVFAKGSIDEEDLRRMPVLNGAIMETMRLYPIAVAQMRTATKDFSFEGYQVREGEMLYMATAVPHFMHEFYPEPEKFDPGRYSKERAEHMKPGAYSPYGRGPHTCLGKSLAEVQLLLSMARVFYRLDLALPSPDYVLKTKTAPTPGPSNDFKVLVKGYRH